MVRSDNRTIVIWNEANKIRCDSIIEQSNMKIRYGNGELVDDLVEVTNIFNRYLTGMAVKYNSPKV